MSVQMRSSSPPASVAHRASSFLQSSSASVFVAARSKTASFHHRSGSPSGSEDFGEGFVVGDHHHNNNNNSESETEGAASGIHTDPELDAQRSSVLTVWATRQRIIAFLQLVASISLCFTNYWYVNFIGVVGALLGILGSIRRKNELVFVYLVLEVLNLAKNVGVLVFMSMEIHSYNAMRKVLFSVLLLDMIFLAPISFYISFYFYQSLKTAFVGLTFGGSFNT
eukprot:TRINITY_DN2013_c0_g1_i1.p2 TRINITY_DN2013_c0_g1~~TRINITY_DN2013_c0_g1_i1.p2  ORF type:complete len:224 (+),score=58.70 TRINITY_DN2013_c0_g1_i1:96-767(+)